MVPPVEVYTVTVGEGMQACKATRPQPKAKREDVLTLCYESVNSNK